MLLAVLVNSAAVDDATAAQDLMAQVDSVALPRLRTVYADNKYRNYALYDWMDDYVNYRLHIVRRPEDAEGFVKLPSASEPLRGWVGPAVEQRLRETH